MTRNTPNSSRLVSLLVFALCFLVLPITCSSSVLAIDYGTDSFKASLIKPGVPFDVLLTKEGKRKIQSLVTIRGQGGKERFVGSDAQNLVTRFPQDSIPSVKLLLGGDGDSEQSELHSRLFSTCPQIKRDYPVEEILSMQFNFAKELAQQELLANSKEEVIRDTIITVPGWFGQTERRRILDAAEISGLKVLNLINDGTAVAINYAMTRQFSPDRPQHHLIYDLGAGSLKVSLVRFKSEMLPDPLSLSNLPSLKNFTTIQVLGYGHDTSVGGYYFDDLIREILIKGFKESQSIDVDVRRDERAMAKLTKESIRVKQVLSANHFASARIEGLIQDLDFDQFSITRQEFEKVLIDKGMKERLIKPIEQAIQDIEDMDMDIDSLIFVGGSSRVPFVQETVSNYLDENTRIKMIAKNVNADEASVLGAGLFGAGLKRGFRTKDLKVLDLYPFPINLRLVDQDQDQESIAFVGANSEIPFKKTFKFVNQTRDFKLELFDPSNANTLILSTSINGITTATSNLTAEGSFPCFVEVEVELDQSGLLKIGEATLILRQEEDDDEVKGSGTVTDKLKGLFNKFGNTTNTTADSAPLEEEELERLPRPTRTKLSIETTSRMMMSQSEKSLVRKKLSEVKASLQRKLLREEAKNSLESFIYKVRDLLSQESSSKFIQSSLESERKTISELNESIGEWLDSNKGEQAKTSEYKEKKSELEKLVKHVLNRSEETEKRPLLIERLKRMIQTAQTFHTQALTTTTDEEEEEEDETRSSELTNLSTLFTDVSNWLETSIKKQSKLTLYQDPILKVKDLEKKFKELETLVEKLSKKKLPEIPKKQKQKTKKNSTTTKEDHKKDEL